MVHIQLGKGYQDEFTPSGGKGCFISSFDLQQELSIKKEEEAERKARRPTKSLISISFYLHSFPLLRPELRFQGLLTQGFNLMHTLALFSSTFFTWLNGRKAWTHSQDLFHCVDHLILKDAFRTYLFVCLAYCVETKNLFKPLLPIRDYFNLSL